MNINIHASQFVTYYVSWLDTKNNTIMPGNFTKICYITPHLTMNGLYLHFPVEISQQDTTYDKTQLKFHPSTPSNLQLIRHFTNIEHKMLDNYIQTQQKNIKKVQLLSKQLMSGFMKVYKENSNTDLSQCNDYCVKISGVWETHNECGLTYKLFGGIRTNDS